MALPVQRRRTGDVSTATNRQKLHDHIAPALPVYWRCNGDSKLFLFLKSKFGSHRPKIYTTADALTM
jgi:hypothetical protein